MLTYDEQEKIERMMAKDQTFQELVTAIKNDYHLTLSQISHEIRNPLTYVNSSMQWIQKMHPEVESFEFWSQMKNDLRRKRSGKMDNFTLVQSTGDEHSRRARHPLGQVSPIFD